MEAESEAAGLVVAPTLPEQCSPPGSSVVNQYRPPSRIFSVTIYITMLDFVAISVICSEGFLFPANVMNVAVGAARELHADASHWCCI